MSRCKVEEVVSECGQQAAMSRLEVGVDFPWRVSIYTAQSGVANTLVVVSNRV